ncbi:MAG: hypothetical protein KatS3mg057_1670 [Herpetosiphonaceae bacterium]|nr:MAG: hypothetical protein KatS3mg057_1670 [Herpetosiphonaceae bacterium]
MESLGRPLIYRSDLQEIGDRYAQKFADEGLGGTALDELNEHLHQLPWYANAPYAALGVYLTAGCKNMDPRDPIHFIGIVSPDVRAITIGVSAVHERSCGPAVSMIYMSSF